jgi:hypothetical protein
MSATKKDVYKCPLQKSTPPIPTYLQNDYKWSSTKKYIQISATERRKKKRIFMNTCNCYNQKSMYNKHSESIAKAIQVPNRSHQIQTCNL